MSRGRDRPGSHRHSWSHPQGPVPGSDPRRPLRAVANEYRSAPASGGGRSTNAQGGGGSPHSYEGHVRALVGGRLPAITRLMHTRLRVAADVSTALMVAVRGNALHYAADDVPLAIDLVVAVAVPEVVAVDAATAALSFCATAIVSAAIRLLPVTVEVEALASALAHLIALVVLAAPVAANKRIVGACIVPRSGHAKLGIAISAIRRVTAITGHEGHGRLGPE
jgi:hypothetical protein